MNNAEQIINGLMGKGLSTFAIYGLLGNLKAESALSPKNLQNSYEKKLGFTDDTYTSAVDSGVYTNFANDQAGYGLAQWTSRGRKQNLLNFAKSTGRSIGDLDMQLEFLWKELSGDYKGVLAGIRAAGSIREASDIVLTKYERPADQSETAKKYRASLGEKLYAEYGKGTAEHTNSIINYTVGVTYTLRANMYVRNAPEGDHLAFGDLTADGKTHAIQDENGVMLRQNTNVTVKEIQILNTGAIWLKIPSGWICGKGSLGRVFVS